MEVRPLAITLLSANHLKDVGHLSKMDVYVEISISSKPKTVKRTPIDKDGGSHPSWNHTVTFRINSATLADMASCEKPVYIIFKLFHDRKVRSDKPVGEVHVAVIDLLSKGGGEVEYPVTEYSSSEKEGMLKFSYQFGEVYELSNHSKVKKERKRDKLLKMLKPSQGGKEEGAQQEGKEEEEEESSSEEEEEETEEGEGFESEFDFEF